MAILPPRIQTYHCICTSLLLATTHTLSSLPRRGPPSLDTALILPLPPTPPTFPAPLASPSPSPAPTNHDDGDAEMGEEQEQDEEEASMPAEGYTMLLGLGKDQKPTMVRRSDGFERRLLYRCFRCGLVVGYEILQDGNLISVDGREGYKGKVIYILPAGVVSTQRMMSGEGGFRTVEGVGMGIEGKGEGVVVGVWE